MIVPKPSLVLIFVTLLAIVLVTVIAIGIALFFNNQRANAISSFAECAEAGHPILESYPERCITPDGKSFTRELTEEEKKLLEDSSYEQDGKLPASIYGSSTFSACAAKSDCQVGGCNSEICGSSADGESMVSICILPAEGQSLPSQAGYSCGCIQNKCLWTK
jgi:hypothetical protein